MWYFQIPQALSHCDAQESSASRVIGYSLISVQKHTASLKTFTAQGNIHKTEKIEYSIPVVLPSLKVKERIRLCCRSLGSLRTKHGT